MEQEEKFQIGLIMISDHLLSIITTGHKKPETASYRVMPARVVPVVTCRLITCNQLLYLLYLTTQQQRVV